MIVVFKIANSVSFEISFGSNTLSGFEKDDAVESVLVVITVGMWFSVINEVDIVVFDNVSLLPDVESAPNVKVAAVTKTVLSSLLF